jgi:hypothetical protein
MNRASWLIHLPPGVFAIPVGLFGVAGAVVEVVRRGGWNPIVGGIALALASAVIAFLAVRTLALLVTGRLLPEVH